MSTGTQTALAGQVETAAKTAGLVVVAHEEGMDFSGGADRSFYPRSGRKPIEDPDARVERCIRLQCAPPLKGIVESYLKEAATRLKNPRLDCYMTLQGLL